VNRFLADAMLVRHARWRRAIGWDGRGSHARRMERILEEVFQH
jgi:uncharacterized protein with PIN domain